MEKIFYRFNDEIYLDYAAIERWAESLGIKQQISKDIARIKTNLDIHETYNNLLLSN